MREGAARVLLGLFWGIAPIVQLCVHSGVFIGRSSIVQQSKTSPSATLQEAQSQVSHISELANRILTGDILLPKFQRDFVWDKKQIIDLLNSIANGYPIGSVLLWRSREQLRSERNIADLQIAPTQVDYPVNYLLDGQQRLSTICGALYWKGGKADSRWNIVYDLRDKKFIHSDH